MYIITSCTDLFPAMLSLPQSPNSQRFKACVLERVTVSLDFLHIEQLHAQALKIVASDLLLWYC